MPPASAPAPRWRANTDLTIDRPGAAPLKFTAGDECVGAPQGWPPAWVVDQGLVSPIETDEPKGGK